MTTEPSSEQPSRAHAGTGIDDTVAHSARVWNYWLGGKDHYAVDRALGDGIINADPQIVDIARASRSFLARAVHHLVREAGVRQFLDVGTGLPTAENTHEIAQRLDPSCRVVYVDNDPLVLAHARALLTGTDEGATSYIDADLYDPEAILRQAAGTVDLDRPVALMLLSVLGHVPTAERARRVVTDLVDALPPGSYLAITDNVDTDPVNARAAELYNSSDTVPYHLRSPEEFTAYFDRVDVVDPGIVGSVHWRPDLAPEPLENDVPTLGAVGRKP
ncbi:SAM-dependent methyltransferase [Salinifilum aidingensis]